MASRRLGRCRANSLTCAFALLGLVACGDDESGDDESGEDSGGDGATTMVSGSATATTGDGGGECPPVLPAGACALACSAPGAACGSTESCCSCQPHEGGADYWVCSGVSSPGCPAEPAPLGDPCPVSLQCWYCDPVFAFRSCDGTQWSEITEWTCPG